MKYSCNGCLYAPYASKDEQRCETCQDCTPNGVVYMTHWAPAPSFAASGTPVKRMLPTRYEQFRDDALKLMHCFDATVIDLFGLIPETVQEKALHLMAEYLGECAECPTAALGYELWPECNGEAEECGDNRTVGECWLRYFVEKAQEEGGEQQ